MEALTHWEGGDPLAAAAAGRGNGTSKSAPPSAGPALDAYSVLLEASAQHAIGSIRSGSKLSE